MLNHIQADHTYRLVLNSKHDLGIRYIKSQHVFEMFDPNLGIVVFNNKDNFITFLAFLHVNPYNEILSTKSRSNHHDLVLYVHDKQPENSIPSIPIPSNPDEKSNGFDHLDFTLAGAPKDEKADICNKKVPGKLGIINDRMTIFLSANVGAGSFMNMCLLLTDYIFEENTPLSTRLSLIYSCAMLGAITGAIYGATSYTPRILVEKSGTYLVNKTMEWIENFSNKNETKHVPNNQNNVQSTQQILTKLPQTSSNILPDSYVEKPASTNIQRGTLFTKSHKSTSTITHDNRELQKRQKTL